MKISNLTKKLVFFGILAAALMVIMPLSTMAGQSGGGAPGSGCDIQNDWLYAPPPFMGEIRVFFNDGGELTVSTFEDAPLEQHGQSGCVMEFDDFSIGSFWLDEDQTIPLDAAAFLEIKSVDMHGLCRPTQTGQITCDSVPASSELDIEVVSVGQMRFGQEVGGRLYFDANVIIMRLRVKL